MPITAILGAHWGDEGKGKVAAALSRRAVACTRFQGGPNAGHTVYCDHSTEPMVLRMVPAGITTGAYGVIGGGCTVNIRMLLDEVAALEARLGDVRHRLLISNRAHIITPKHLKDDRDGAQHIGTTRMGVGPAYADRAARRGYRVGDVMAGRIGDDAGLEPGQLEEFRDTLGRSCGDDSAFLRHVLDRGGRVIAEGAQGMRLDVDHGDYPYVTSSNTTVGAVLTGLGVGPRDIDEVLLVTPPYVTKVGGGTLPNRVKAATEAELRRRGAEVDGVTGAVRDIGWLDLSWLRHAVMVNQATGLLLTKVDCAAGFAELCLIDASRTIRVRPWSIAECESPYESRGLGAFITQLENETMTEVVAVSNGAETDAIAFKHERVAVLA